MSINVAAFMDNAQARADIERIQAMISQDAVMSKLIEAAQTIEEAYQVVTRYATIKFEDFKEVCDGMMAYFQGPKVALDDNIMECVVGGGFWGNLWNKCKTVAVSAAFGLLVGGLVAGGILVTAPLCLATAVVAGVVGVGVAVGLGTGMYCIKKEQEEFDKNYQPKS